MSRAFGFLTLLFALATGLYFYMQQTKSVSPAGASASPRATIDLVGVKNDLLQFGRAEQQHMASEGKYLSLDELRASDTGLPNSSRGPYQYSIEADASSFSVVATYSGPALDGAPKTLRVGPDMTVQTE